MAENVFVYSIYFSLTVVKKQTNLVTTNVEQLQALASGRMGLKRKDVGQKQMQLVAICSKSNICIIDFTESVNQENQEKQNSVSLGSYEIFLLVLVFNPGNAFLLIHLSNTHSGVRVVHCLLNLLERLIFRPPFNQKKNHLKLKYTITQPLKQSFLFY